MIRRSTPPSSQNQMIPVMNANGPVVFSKQHGQLDLLSQTELQQFCNVSCSSADAAADWEGPAGLATCGTWY
jgi:hypothetical protein